MSTTTTLDHHQSLTTNHSLSSPPPPATHYYHLHHYGNGDGHDCHQFNALEEFVSEANNHERLRVHVATCKPPCIPYLGIYLTDLIHLDVAEGEVRVSCVLCLY